MVLSEPAFSARTALEDAQTMRGILNGTFIIKLQEEAQGQNASNKKPKFSIEESKIFYHMSLFLLSTIDREKM